MLKEEYPELAKYWNCELNNKNGLHFEDVSPGSGKKAWWNCDNGHLYQCRIIEKTKKHYGCPYCSHHKVLNGINDLATMNPSITFEWNYEKNGNITPNDVLPNSGKKVWWKCKKGHEWEAIIQDRNKGQRCPYCSNKRVLKGFNDLATSNPTISKEWNYEKNSNLNPTEVAVGSHKKVWWKCKHGHEWQAIVYDRSNGNGCPYCAGKKVLPGLNDLRTTNPELAEEWNRKKNGNLKPEDVSAGSGKKVWWKCKYGHEWQAAIHSRNSGVGCPFCAGNQVSIGLNDLVTINPKLADEWNYKKNVGLSPMNFSANSGKTVWWKCKYGHEWQASIYNRNHNHSSCPICNMHKVTSVPEKTIVYYLRKAGFNVEENKKIIGKKEADIYIPEKKLAIEYDGKYWHSNKYKDIKKNNLFKKEGITLLRIREPGLPTLNNTSIDFILNKPDRNYLYLESAISKLLNYLGVKEYDVNLSRDIQEIYSLHSKAILIDSVKNIASLEREWNYEKNIISIESVSRGSHKKVWWKCKHGHEWQAIVYDRSNGNGCPYCSGRKVLAGFNDLATTRKDLLLLWNHKKNKTITPDNITAGSHKKVWWKCDRGHEWKAAIYNIAKGERCPYCAGKKRP